MSRPAKSINIALSLIILMLVLAVFTSRAEAKSTDYTLDGTDRIPIPETYVVKNVIYNPGAVGEETGRFKEAEDLFINAQGYLFIADTGNNRILKLTREGMLADIFKEADGVPFRKPRGIFVDEDGNMYVADTGNSRIVHLSAGGEFVESFLKPESELIDEEFFEYAPSKISISPTGYIYVLKDESIFMMDAYNGFRGYLGQTEIGFNFVDVLLRKVASDKQKESIVKRSAAPFINMHVDKTGIIYVTTLDTKDDNRKKLIKKLNAIGENIYVEKDFGEEIYFSGSIQIPRFNDITAFENGILTVVDEYTCNVYQYDQDGNLLTAFGGYGDQRGKFVLPVAIESDSEGNIYVLDKTMNIIYVFAPTKFISLVHEALDLYYNGEYDGAKSVWEQVLKIDENYRLAHLGIAKALYKQKSWKEAMDEFKEAEDKDGYSKAFTKYRYEIFRSYFIIVVLALALTVYLVLRGIGFLKKAGENTLDGLRGSGSDHKGIYGFLSFLGLSVSVLFHPIETFEIVKMKRAKTHLANNILILLVAVAVRIFYIYTVHYPLAGIEPRDANIWLEMLRILLPVLTWVVASFAITAILDGESTITEVLTTSSLCMVPYIIINIPLALFSNVLGKDEKVLYSLISYGSLIWVFLLFFIGIKTSNDYKMLKSVIATFMSAVGMLLIWAVVLILFVFTIQLYEFASGLFQEVRMLTL